MHAGKPWSPGRLCAAVLLLSGPWAAAEEDEAAAIEKCFNFGQYGQEDLDLVIVNVAKSAEREEWAGVLPLECDDQPKWRKLRRLMEESPRAGVDNAPCAELTGDFELLSQAVHMAFDEGHEYQGWFGTGMFCNLCAILEDDPSDAFCTFGVISAFACATRLCAFTKKYHPADWEALQATAKDVEGSEPVCQLAFDGLTNMMGSATNYLELLQDSGWPWTQRSLWMVRGEFHDVEFLDEDVLRRLSAMAVAPHREYLLELEKQAERMGALESLGRLPEINLFVLGMHTGLLREPLLALKELLPGDVAMALRAPCGGDALCTRVAGVLCEPRDEFFQYLVDKHLYKKYANSFQNMFSDKIDSLFDMRRSFIGYYREQMIGADILMCSEPLGFCSFFDGAGIPVVAYAGNGPTFYLQGSDGDFMFESIARILTDTRSTAIGMNLGLTIGLHHNMQRRIPNLMPMARHLFESKYGWNPAPVRGMGTLLISKRVIASWDIRCLMQMILFRGQGWMSSMVKNAEPGIDAERLDTPLPYVVQVGELDKELSRIEAWVTFRAALVLPWDISGLYTYDFYALGMPMLMPHPTRFLPSFLFRSFGMAVRSKAPPPPPPKWLNTGGGNPWALPVVNFTFGRDTGAAGGWDSQRLGALVSDNALLPHIIFIEALADCIAHLLDMEGLRATSRSMIAHHRSMHARSKVHWASVYARALLPAGPGEGRRTDPESLNGLHWGGHDRAPWADM